MAARSATVTAEGSSGTISCGWKDGIERRGKPVGIPPNLDPIVSTGIPDAATRSVKPSIATMDPGTRLVTRGQEESLQSFRCQ